MSLLVEQLEEKMLATGSGGSRFSVEPFQMWYLWSANEVGVEETNSYLDHFMDSKTLTVLKTLWVSGIDVDQQVDLGNGYLIQPVGLMVDSADKERLIRRRLLDGGFPSSVPTCAIVKNCIVPKILDDSSNQDESVNTSRRMTTITLLLNLFESVCCVQNYSTSYFYPSTPPGPFSPSGGGWPMYDVAAPAASLLKIDVKEKLSSLADAYEKLGSEEQQKFHRIIERLSQAKRRYYIEDRILDLGIAMEMLLLDDNKNSDQLALMFRLRGAWLIGKSGEDRLVNCHHLNKIYKYRSQVAHTGILCNGNRKKIEEVELEFPIYLSIAEKICGKLLINGKPQWEKLILDAVEPTS